MPFERLCRGAACEPIELAASARRPRGHVLASTGAGIRLVRVNDTAQLATAPEYAEQVRAALEMRRAPALSQPSLEVLAIIAANQPTTRAYIEQVRGGGQLLYGGRFDGKRGIVEEAGASRRPWPLPAARTTPEFLRIFGVSSYAELAELPEIRALRAEELKPAGDESPGKDSLEAGQGLPVPCGCGDRRDGGANVLPTREAYEPEELQNKRPVEAESGARLKWKNRNRRTVPYRANDGLFLSRAARRMRTWTLLAAGVRDGEST